MSEIIESLIRRELSPSPSEWAKLQHKYQRSRPNHSSSGQSFIILEPRSTIDLLFHTSNYLDSASISATANMRPQILAMLSLSALACASAVDTQLIGSDPQTDVPSCFWSGTAPFCAGSCDVGYTDCGTSGCGDGACCVTGYKKYCCLGGCPVGKALEIGESPNDAVPKSELDGGENNGTSDHKE
ncbi:hypothetical protein F4824DRAFT_480562 [Ustulina deusta]|nr:hypothetical protein F4824DRAFT_480562 [Ustulina deusta]